ncbi:hypothetical protein [Hugenholtzia roseola]|uniref:hypothetical protein n=1 Tax=Hugenholtzia roseola TaxID=1002 RepID=UPI000410ACBC|nr:hypothetical protein [Hugenholtzia roseola]
MQANLLFRSLKILIGVEKKVAKKGICRPTFFFTFFSFSLQRRAEQPKTKQGS